MECSNCKENIVIPDSTNPTICSKNIAVKKGDSYICNACHEASMLFCDISEPKKQKIEVNKIKFKVKPSKSKFVCVKCKESYEGKMCHKCKTPNPMYMRKPSKNKKKCKKKKR